MSESNVRALLRRRLRDLHAKSIENRCEKGTPDLTYIYGWIELKWMRGWPVKGGPVAISHYTIHQRLWLRKHWEMGGRSFLGLVANKEWLLWAGCDALPVGYLTRDELYQTCLWRAPSWDEKGFRNIIQSPRPYLDLIREEKGLCDSPLLKNFSLSAVVGKKTSTQQRRAAASAITATSSSNAGMILPTDLKALFDDD